jgi:predicted CoA-binding protein
MSREKIIEVISNTIFQSDMEDDCEDIGASVLTALEAAGYAIVPVEPTEEMAEAATVAIMKPRMHVNHTRSDRRADACIAYRAMIQSAKSE